MVHARKSAAVRASAPSEDQPTGESVDQHGPPKGQTHQVGEAAQERLLSLGTVPEGLRAFEPTGRRVQGLYEDLGPDR
jgi:hypothetical protein